MSLFAWDPELFPKSLQLLIKPYPSPLFQPHHQYSHLCSFWLQTHRLLCYSSNVSKMPPPSSVSLHVLALRLEKLFSSRNHSLSAFRSLIKCHLLNEILPDHAILSAILDPTPLAISTPLPFL